MEKQTVIVNVVGIRHNLPNEEADYRELFARCPVGSMVNLRVVPEGEKYPGSVEVLDSKKEKIGSLSKTEKRLLILEIPEGGNLPVKVYAHCPEHNCIKVVAENTKGFDVPHIGHIEKETGETVFLEADIDIRRKRWESHMRTLIGTLKAKERLEEDDLKTLTEAIREYTPLCCTSIDGDTQFIRAEILMYIDTIRVRYDYAPLKDAYWEAYELHKDQSKKEDQTRIFREQFDRMRQYAQAHAEGKDCSPLEEYRDTLAFVNGGKLTREILEAEHIRLANLLSDTLDGKYVEWVKEDEEFAKNIYMLNYDLNSLYTLFTRRLKHEYIGQQLEEYETKKSKAPKPNRTAKERVTMTFVKGNGVVDGHITLLYLELTEAGWIEGTEEDFKDLFSGSTKPCWLTWKKKFGKSTLVALFKKMVDENAITLAKGYTLSSVLEGHFKDMDGNALTGLDKGDAPNAKAQPMIDKCVKILSIDPDNPDLDEIQDLFDSNEGCIDPYDHQNLSIRTRRP